MARDLRDTFDAIVVGAGLAGAFAADALTRRKLRVLVLEREAHHAALGSGNPFGLVVPYLAARPSPLATVYKSAFAYSRETLVQFEECVTPSGALQLPSTPRLARDMDGHVPLTSHPSARRVSAVDASEIAGVTLSSNAFWLEDALYARPPELVAAALASVTEHRVRSHVSALSFEAGSWSVWIQGETTPVAHAPIVVVCSAYESATIAQLTALPLEPIRGQTIMVAETPFSKDLRCPLCFDGYIVPSVNGSHMVGALYRHHDLDCVPSASDSQRIIDRCHPWFPAGFEAPLSARVCFRTSTFDRLPYIGAMPDVERFERAAAQFQSGTDILSKVETSLLPGLFVSLGHGSKGLQSSPWGGEIIARLVTGESLDSLEEGAYFCRPERILGRALRRRE